MSMAASHEGAGGSTTSGVAEQGYAELHCLSNFSFLRGASQPVELVERAHALGYHALALTDECSVAGVVRAHTRARELGLRLTHRRRVQARLRPRVRAAGRNAAWLRAAVPADHARAPRCAEGPLPAHAR